MSNNISVSITADVADLKVKRAILSAELATARKDLKDFAATAKTSGMSDELRTSMLASANALRQFESQIGNTDRRLKKLTESLNENSRGHHSNRAATEGLVIVHEALSGNFHRMIGSLMIEAQALAGAERTAKALNAVLTPMGLTAAGGAIAFAALAAATIQYYRQQEQLTATTLGLGAASGLTGAQLEDAAGKAAAWSGQSRRAMLEASEAFAGAGVRSEATISTLSASIQTYAALTGQKAADAQKTLAAAMADPVKGAEMLNEQLGILDGTQLRAIRTAVEQGDKQRAVAIITQALTQRTQEANAAGVGATGSFDRMVASLSNLWGWLGRVGDEMSRVAQAENTMFRVGGLAGVRAASAQLTGPDPGAAAAAVRKAQQEAALKRASSAGAALEMKTPAGQDATARAELVGNLKVVQAALAADTRLYGAHSQAVKDDTAAVAAYQRAVDSYLPSAKKAHDIAQLDAQIATARQKHDRAGVASLTKQREMLNLSGQVMTPGDAAQRADDASDKGSAGVHAPKAHDDRVQQWTEQLHASQIASGEYFKDQTAAELAFWQGKLAETQKGSKDWLAVQAHVFEASKTLAHQSYEAQLADIAAKMEADKNSWSAEAADWQQRLALVRSSYGEQSAEYKNAYREWEAAERQHNEEMLRQQDEAGKKALASLKRQLDEAKRTRDDNARSAETVAKDNAGGSPMGEVSAAAKVALIHRQATDQEIADLERFQAAQDQALDASIARAQSVYGEESAQYRAALQAKADADQEYAERRRELEARSHQQSIQDIMGLKQAYHGYVDGLVSTMGTGLSGVLSRQRSWAQAGASIYQNVAGLFERSIERMAAKWIVEHVLMSAAQRAQLAVQTGQQIASEAAKTGATVVGGQARVAAAGAAAGETAVIATASNQKEVGGAAATAAANVYKSVSAIPGVGPILAPPAAAAAFTAVEAFSSMAGFAVGANVIPSDMIAQIHAGERIIPKADNAKLMAAVDRGTGGGGSGGDTHHYHITSNVDPRAPFADQLHAHEMNVAAMVGRMIKNPRRYGLPS